ncbi:MAG: hypothetical protein Q9178_002960 [Gyalolechia marmorata]
MQHDMASDMKYDYFDDNEIITGEIRWLGEETSYNETTPLRPIASSANWILPAPFKAETLHSIFIHIAALIAVMLFGWCLCKWSQYTGIRPSTRAGLEHKFQAKLAKKDRKLQRISAVNEEHVETIHSINGQRKKELKELITVTNELQRYCVNYPILEGRIVRLEDQSALDLKRLIETENEMADWREEAVSLRGRLTRLKACLPSTPTKKPPVGKMRAGGTQDDSESEGRLAAMRAEKKDAIADKIKAEAERDQAVSNEKKAVEECSRKTISLKSLMGSSGQTMSDLQKKIKDLETTVEQLTGTVKDLEVENNKQSDALKSSVTDGEMLEEAKERLQSEESNVRRLEQELKESKEKAEVMANDAAKSSDFDGLLQARDTKIRQLEDDIQTLKELERRYAADIESWEKSRNDYNTNIQNLQAGLNACTIQYDNATRDYNGNVQSLQDSLNTRTQEFEKSKEYHHQSARHVEHLKQVLDGVMKGLGVTGSLDSPQGLKDVHRNLEHNFGQTIGCINRLQGVLREAMGGLGVVGSVHDPKGLDEVQKELKALFKTFESIEVAPRMLASMKEELKTLRGFKSQMLSASQGGGQEDDLEGKLKQARASVQILGKEMLVAKNENMEQRGTIKSLRSQVKRLDELQKGGVKSSQVDQSKIRKMEDEYEKLKKDMDNLGSRKVTAKEDLERLGEQVNTLRKEKEELKKQKAKLWRHYNKPSGRPDGPSQALEKRSHGDHSGDENSRSAKQARNEIVAPRGAGSA